MANPHRFSFRLSLALVTLVASWLVFSQLVVPPLIRSAYRGESLPALNGIISGQAVHPVQHYLTEWDKVAWFALLILLLAGLIILIISNPESQRSAEARLGIIDKNALTIDSLATLERYRVWVAYAVIIVITGGSLFDIVNDTEHWPFSSYPMYSGVDRDYSLTASRLFGVTESEPPHEIPLWEFQYIQPFDNARLYDALNWMLEDPRREQRHREALCDVLLRYEALRHAGRHNGPPLQGIRLYHLYWKLDPWARNADRPDHRELVLEVMDPVKK